MGSKKKGKISSVLNLPPFSFVFENCLRVKPYYTFIFLQSIKDML